MNTYIIFGILALIGIFVLISWNSKRNSNTHGIAENKTEFRNREIRQEKRELKLIITYDYGEKTEIITEKATAEIIKSKAKNAWFMLSPFTSATSRRRNSSTKRMKEADIR